MVPVRSDNGLASEDGSSGDGENGTDSRLFQRENEQGLLMDLR